MDEETHHQALRRKLQEMTEADDESQYSALLDAAIRSCPNSIEIVELASPD